MMAARADRRLIVRSWKQADLESISPPHKALQATTKQQSGEGEDDIDGEGSRSVGNGHLTTSSLGQAHMGIGLSWRNW